VRDFACHLSAVTRNATQTLPTIFVRVGFLPSSFAFMNALRLAARRANVISTLQSRSAGLLSRFSSTLTRTCPSCSAPLHSSLPTCLQCSYIQPLSSDVTYYDMLGLSYSKNPFKVDVKNLRQKFLQAQRVCHPDAWSGKGEVCHQCVLLRMPVVNTGFRKSRMLQLPSHP
jgi:molecular chaperone HscB